MGFFRNLNEISLIYEKSPRKRTFLLTDLEGKTD